MKYIVECRAKDEQGNITGSTFRGFGDGLPNKKTANMVFDREVNSGKWDAVYMEKIDKDYHLIDEKEWYSEKAI